MRLSYLFLLFSLQINLIFGLEGEDHLSEKQVTSQQKTAQRALRLVANNAYRAYSKQVGAYINSGDQRHEVENRKALEKDDERRKKLEKHLGIIRGKEVEAYEDATEKFETNRALHVVVNHVKPTKEFGYWWEIPARLASEDPLPRPSTHRHRRKKHY